MKMILPEKTLSLVLITILIISATGIWWGLPNHVSWSSDDIGGPLTLGHIYHGLSNSYRNPPFHFVINAAFYSPYLAYLYFTGSIQSPTSVFPYGFAEPIASMTVLHLITRAINLVMAVGTAFFVYLISMEIFKNRRAALLSSLLMGLCPLFVMLSKIGRLDVPMVFYATVSLYFMVRILRGEKERDYVLFGLFMAFAVATKLQAISLYAILLPVLLYFHMRRNKSLMVSLKDRRLLLMITVFLVTSLFAHNLFDVSENIFRFEYWTHGYGLVGYAEFQNTVEGHLMLLSKTINTLAASMGMASLLAAAGGIIIALRKGVQTRFVLLLLAIVVIQYIFLFDHLGFVLQRYILLMLVPLSVMGGWFLSWMWEGDRIRKGVVIFILLFSLSQAVATDHLMLNDSRYHAEHWIELNVPKDAEIELYLETLTEMPRLDVMGYTNINRMEMNRETMNTLQERGPDYVLMRPLTYRTSDHEKNFYSLIVGGKLGYLVEKRFKSSSFLFPDVYPNYVNPEIIILKKA